MRGALIETEVRTILNKGIDKGKDEVSDSVNMIKIKIGEMARWAVSPIY